MQELRLVAVSEDGSYAVLVVPGRSGRFAMPIDERLRAVARGQFSRLAQYEIEVESPLRPKEIQDRIRAGETAEEIADAAGLPVDRIRRFEGPVLAEREFRAQEAQRATVRGRGDAGPWPRLGEIVAERLARAGAGEDAEWDSRKRQDGNWQVQLAYTVAGRMHLAEWVYDARSKHVVPDDDEAIRLCLDESEWPEPGPGQALTATVTPIGSRAMAASHQPAPQDRAGDRGLVHPSRLVPAEAASLASGALPGRVRPGGPAQARPTHGKQQPAEQASVAMAADRETAPGVAAHADQQPMSQPADDAADRGQRPQRRTPGRPRRSSVPSWDEIMFGTSRQPD
jgi:hypothetical protein